MPSTSKSSHNLAIVSQNVLDHHFKMRGSDKQPLIFTDLDVHLSNMNQYCSLNIQLLHHRSDILATRSHFSQVSYKIVSNSKNIKGMD